ncbi:MAG: quinolinate synthase NadA [Anaerolineae bacterium]|nr:quinolinate synthase NadA [Anaerolineae bacterium]
MSLDIVGRIEELKEERGVAIIAHHYAPVEVHSVADVLSDSRGFFGAIMGEIHADTILVIAPTFFAEITAALQPDKKVLLPAKSECPVAEHRYFGFDHVAQFKAAYPGIPLVCYGTSPLMTKLLADYVALPGEVVQTIEAINAPEVLFVGEKNCADDARRKCRKKITPYPENPVCNVYNGANCRDVEALKAQYPDSCVMVHPECKPEVIELADYAMGTGKMRELIKADSGQDTYILGTELGFFQRMQQEFPEKTFLHLSPYLTCNVFKPLRLDTVLNAIETGHPIVRVDKVIAGHIKALFAQLLELDL